MLLCLKVIRDLIMVMRGHMVQNRKKVVTYDIERCFAFFDIHNAFSFHLICTITIFLVIIILTIRGQIMVMRGHKVQNRIWYP